jgi:hypothetical protein
VLIQQDCRFAFFPRDVVHGSAVPQSIPKVGELAALSGQCLFAPRSEIRTRSSSRFSRTSVVRAPQRLHAVPARGS